MSYLKIAVLLCFIGALPVHAVPNGDRVSKVGPYHFSEPVTECMEIGPFNPNRPNEEYVKNKCNFDIVAAACLTTPDSTRKCLSGDEKMTHINIGNDNDFNMLRANRQNSGTLFYSIGERKPNGEHYTDQEKRSYPRISGACAVPPGYVSARLARFVDRTTGEYEKTGKFACHLATDKESRGSGVNPWISNPNIFGSYCYPASYKGPVTQLMQPCSR